MSTEIRSLFTKSTAVLTIRSSSLHHTDVLVCADEADATAAACVTRADLLAAVETECGVRIAVAVAVAIVIDRVSLPAVTPGDDDTYAQVQTNGGPDGFSTGPFAAGPDHYRRVALAALAKAEYLAAHPPVPLVSDEDVETLAGLVQPFVSGYVPDANAKADQIARRLFATGRVSVLR